MNICYQFYLQIHWDFNVNSGGRGWANPPERLMEGHLNAAESRLHYIFEQRAHKYSL